MDASLDMFLEEWLLASLALLLLFLAGYLLWKLKRRPAATNPHIAPPKAAAPGKADVFPEAGAVAAERERPDPDKERVALLEKTLDEILAGDAQASLPSVPEGIAPQVRKQVEHSFKELDAFGLTFQKMQVFNDPNASLQRLTQAITNDIVFSSKVLKQANSPYFGMPGQVSSLHHAVLILGINNLKTLYFKDHFKMIGKEGGRFTIIRQKVWRHSIVTAILAAHLCRAFRLAPPETAFTLGLLHDVGKLVLADMAENMAANGQEPPDYAADWSVEMEQEVFGVEHAAIGRLAASAWNLPKETAMVIGAHHHMRLDADAADDSAKAQVLTLAVADSLAHALQGEPWTPLPAKVAEKLNNRKRMLQTLQDRNLHEELELARAMV